MKERERESEREGEKEILKVTSTWLEGAHCCAGPTYLWQRTGTSSRWFLFFYFLFFDSFTFCLLFQFLKEPTKVFQK